jgi:hypothetical protein
MVHSPARWAPYGRPETSRLLEVDHYMLHMRIKMRLVRWAASSLSTDAKTGGGVTYRPAPPAPSSIWSFAGFSCGRCSALFTDRQGLLPTASTRIARLSTVWK